MWLFASWNIWLPPFHKYFLVINHHNFWPFLFYNYNCVLILQYQLFSVNSPLSLYLVIAMPYYLLKPVFVTQGKVRENMNRWIIPNRVMVIINIVFLHRLYNNLAVHYTALVSFGDTALKYREQKLWVVLTILKKKEKKSMADYQASSGTRTKSSTGYLLFLHYTQIFGELKNIQVVWK